MFVANALNPAQVLSVDINAPNKTATVIVPERQLSLAIGKEGQNARLAARLTGWRIDIKALPMPPRPVAATVVSEEDVPEAVVDAAEIEVDLAVSDEEVQPEPKEEQVAQA